MKKIVLGLGMIFLTGWSPAYTADCTTMFDQSCLSGEYDAEEVKAANRRSVEKLEQRRDNHRSLERLERSMRSFEREILNTAPSSAAETYMEREGWEKVQVLDSFNSDSSDWLVVRVDPFTTWAVEEPMFSSFPPGEYWAKVMPLYGISKMLDSSGREHDFLLSKSVRID